MAWDGLIAALRAIVDSLIPVGQRARATIYDGYVGSPDIAPCPLKSITVPTLVIAAEDDTLAPYADSRTIAERIPARSSSWSAAAGTR